ncbi:MAG: UvrD-helicase domain-containing protein, partial [Pseudomonadota bacterium]
MTPLEETTHNQRRAANPAQSAFVMANAGSGKTRVLTNRVARLLLADAPPEKILCITFTKAAAAEMAERLFSVLGEWALADDEKLLEALGELEGEAKSKKGPNELIKARRLFARALETPGGLKIQTIHSFCETVLRRFPIEAGAPPGFSVLEDTQAAALKHDALDRVGMDAKTDAEISAAFHRLSLRRNERDLRDLLLGACTQVFDIPAASEALAQELAINPAHNADDVKRAFLAGLSDSDLRRAHDGLAAEGKSPQHTAAIVSEYLNTPDADVKWSLLCSALLISDQSKPRD